MSHHGPARHYRVDGRRLHTLEEAAGRAVALSVQRRESVAIEAWARGRQLETIDVTATLSIDTTTTTEEG